MRAIETYSGKVARKPCAVCRGGFYVVPGRVVPESGKIAAHGPEMWHRNEMTGHDCPVIRNWR